MPSNPSTRLNFQKFKDWAVRYHCSCLTAIFWKKLSKLKSLHRASRSSSTSERPWWNIMRLKRLSWRPWDMAKSSPWNSLPTSTKFWTSASTTARANYLTLGNRRTSGSLTLNWHMNKASRILLTSSTPSSAKTGWWATSSSSSPRKSWVMMSIWRRALILRALAFFNKQNVPYS